MTIPVWCMDELHMTRADTENARVNYWKVEPLPIYLHRFLLCADALEKIFLAHKIDLRNRITVRRLHLNKNMRMGFLLPYSYSVTQLINNFWYRTVRQLGFLPNNVYMNILGFTDLENIPLSTSVLCRMRFSFVLSFQIKKSSTFGTTVQSYSTFVLKSIPLSLLGLTLRWVHVGLQL